MLYSENLESTVLYKPAERDCTQLKIISGFTDSERISSHCIGLLDGMKEHKFSKIHSIQLILGMTSSVTVKKHMSMCRAIKLMQGTKNMPDFSLRYIATGKPVHSKIYIWQREETPTIAFCGSLNYSMNAFKNQRESVSDCDPVDALDYYRKLFPDTISCFSEQVPDLLKQPRNNIPLEDYDMFSEDYDTYATQQPIDTLNVSLLGASGKMGYGSGPNWGWRQNGTPRNPNQAYIPYNRNDRKEGFFPGKTNPDDKNCPLFRVITKDYGSFHMRIAQQNNKALESAESNAILGEWIRKRLGVPDGCYVTKQMLENYGKTFVTFSKYADGTYLLDF